MAFVPVPFTVEVELVYNISGIIVENTFYYKSNTAPTPSLLTGLALLVDTAWHNNLRGQLVSICRLQLIRCRDLSAQNGFGVELAPSAPATGALTDTCAPLNVTLAIKRVTGLLGRSFRGRIYWPGISENKIVPPNSVNPTWRDEVVLAVGNFTTSIQQDGTWQEVVVSRYSGVDAAGKPIPRVTGLTTVVTGHNADTDLDSQRRRLNGRGN
jgi:hypothetical protein